MAYVQTNADFPDQPPVYWTPPAVAVQQGGDWEPIFWTTGAVGPFALLSDAFDIPKNGAAERVDEQGMTRGRVRRTLPSESGCAW